MKECKKCLNKTYNDEFCDTCLNVNYKLSQLHRLERSPKEIIKFLSKKYKNKKVILGLSGGVDSSYIAVLAAEANLDIQAIHFDNGWNTKLASENISNIVNRYSIPLKTYVMDWPTFKSLQRSFLKSSVPDTELVTDHAIFALMTKEVLSTKNSVFLSGANFATEHDVTLKYTWFKLDSKNIKSINSSFENYDISNYPMTNPLEWAFLRLGGGGAKIETPLNYFNYRRSDAISYMQSKTGFKDYEFKHEESLFTKIFQRVILKQKFGYDKVYDHVNSLIRNNELSKETALIQIENFKNYDPMNDYNFRYFLDKLEFSLQDWQEILSTPKKSHKDFSNDYHLISMLTALGKILGARGSE